MAENSKYGICINGYYGGPDCVYIYGKDPKTGESLRLPSAKYTMALNKAGTAEFTIPPDNPGYDLVIPMVSDVEIAEIDDVIWTGRVTEVTTDFYNRKICYCEGALAFFNDSIQPHKKWYQATVAKIISDILTEHNRQVKENRRIIFQELTAVKSSVKIDYSTEGESTLSVLQDLLDKYEGYMFVWLSINTPGKKYFHWIKTYDTRSTQPIAYGENLLDISRKVNLSDACTVIFPQGEDVEVREYSYQTDDYGDIKLDSLGNPLIANENGIITSHGGDVYLARDSLNYKVSGSVITIKAFELLFNASKWEIEFTSGSGGDTIWVEVDIKNASSVENSTDRELEYPIVSVVTPVAAVNEIATLNIVDSGKSGDETYEVGRFHYVRGDYIPIYEVNTYPLTLDMVLLEDEDSGSGGSGEVVIPASISTASLMAAGASSTSDDPTPIRYIRPDASDYKNLADDPRFIISPYAAVYGNIVRRIKFNGATDVSTLRTKATEWLEKQGLDGLSIDVNAVDLRLLDPTKGNIRIGQLVTVTSKPHSVRMSLIIMQIDCDITKLSKQLTIGRPRDKSLSDIAGRSSGVAEVGPEIKKRTKVTKKDVTDGSIIFIPE